MPEYVAGDEVEVELVLSCPDPSCTYCPSMNGMWGTLILERNDEFGHDWLIELVDGSRGFFSQNEFKPYVTEDGEAQ